MRAESPGRFHSLGPLEFDGFARREVRIYEPSDAVGHVRPLLVLFDGQNVFDDVSVPGWRIHTAIDGLDRRRSVAPRVLAIPSEADARPDELTLWQVEGYGRAGGRAAAFVEAVVHRVLPAARQRFATPEGALGVVIGGASWGGAVALYAHYQHASTFGGALCLSPAFWVGNFAIFDWIRERATPTFSRLYLDCGGLEAEGRMLAAAERMAAHLLRDRRYSRKQFWWRPDPPADHHELAWRRRLPRALRFMYRR